MQVLQQSNNDEETCNDKKYSSRCQLLKTFLSESISELNSAQNSLSDIQKQTALLFQKNQETIDKYTQILENLDSNYHLKDVFTQSRTIEVRNVSTFCNTLPTQSDIQEKVNLPLKESTVELNKNDSKTIDKPNESENKVVEVNKTEEKKVNKKSVQIENIEMFSANDMLTYLSRYKLDFIKFLQCNRNNIEQIAGGYSDLIQGFNNSPITNGGITSGNPNDQVSGSNVKRRRSSRSDHKSKRSKTQSLSESGLPGVIDTTDNVEDPILKSNLYDDIDFHEPAVVDRAELNCQDTVTVTIPQDDVTKLGGEKRLNAMGMHSKMNLLKSRIDKSSVSKPKKTETWKNEIKKLEVRHDNHYSASTATVDQNNGHNKRETKPFETVFTARMKERLKNSQKPRLTEGSDNHSTTDLVSTSSSNQPASLAVVKYDLSTPNDPPFQLDFSKQQQQQYNNPNYHHREAAPVPPETSSKSTKKVDCSPVMKSSDLALIASSTSPTKKNRHSSRDKSKHKHKHSSKKKAKKLSKDLEDGEIV